MESRGQLGLIKLFHLTGIAQVTEFASASHLTKKEPRLGLFLFSVALESAENADLEPFGPLDLLEPVEAHLFDDAAGDHDDARLVLRIGVEMLIGDIGRDLDEVALFPFELLGFR